MHPRDRKAVVAVLLICACGLAGGASKTATFNVNASVQSSCSIDFASTMGFGTLVSGAGDVDRTSTIAVRCSSGVPYGIGLSAGTAAGSSFAQRTLKSPTVTGTLEYNLYTSSARNTVWENPVSAAAVANNQGGIGSGLGTVIQHTVHGRLQDSPTSKAAKAANNYSSTITVTLNY